MNTQKQLEFLQNADKKLEACEKDISTCNQKFRLALLKEAEAKINMVQRENESENQFALRIRKETIKERKNVLITENDLRNAVRLFNVLKERINLAKFLLQSEGQKINLQRYND